LNYFLDTNALIWRFLDPRKLSAKMKNVFAGEDNLYLVPTVSLLELQYLKEIGRIEVDIDQFLQTLRQQEDFRLVPFDETVLLASLRLTSNRDPFDRIILAHAIAASIKILSRDRWMQQTAPELVVS
jgi:PIN domain nuclease of toxin-antitoxin system